MRGKCAMHETHGISDQINTNKKIRSINDPKRKKRNRELMRDKCAMHEATQHGRPKIEINGSKRRK